jgi:hypothetical protein
VKVRNKLGIPITLGTFSHRIQTSSIITKSSDFSQGRLIMSFCMGQPAICSKE